LLRIRTVTSSRK